MSEWMMLFETFNENWKEIIVKALAYKDVTCNTSNTDKR